MFYEKNVATFFLISLYQMFEVSEGVAVALIDETNEDKATANFSPDDIIALSAFFSITFSFLSVLLAICIFFWIFKNVNCYLIQLREKVEALDARLQVRVIGEDMFMRLCEIVGANYTEVSNERSALTKLLSSPSPSGDQLRKIAEEAYARCVAMSLEIPVDMGFRPPTVEPFPAAGAPELVTAVPGSYPAVPSATPLPAPEPVQPAKPAVPAPLGIPEAYADIPQPDGYETLAEAMGVAAQSAEPFALNDKTCVPASEELSDLPKQPEPPKAPSRKSAEKKTTAKEKVEGSVAKSKKEKEKGTENEKEEESSSDDEQTDENAAGKVGNKRAKHPAATQMSE